MTRELNTATLEVAAEAYAGHFLLPTQSGKTIPEIAASGHDWCMQNLFNAHFKDEHEFLVAAVRGELGPKALARFDAEAKEMFSPRDDAVFVSLLAKKLAITPDGKHIPGKTGTVQRGTRCVGTRMSRFGKKNAYWPIYAGEEEERALSNVREKGKDGPGVDPLPPTDTHWPGEDLHMGGPTKLFALNTNVGIVFAQAALDPA
ncbi:hypothetical protein LCGC14_1332150, partial [marine sediment metagenome]